MKEVLLTRRQARRLWLAAQRLDVPAPFGSGPGAVAAAVGHLGYVQIDTINVIERSHHHILFNRIPDYRRADLAAAQSADKSVFEYWTHALAYVATADLRIFLAIMAGDVQMRRWYADIDPEAVKPVLRRIRREGPITIRDVDDEPVEKTHPWASRKPTKRLLQLGFVNGQLAISERQGMVKTYELMDRHFGWPPRPRAATAGQVLDYYVDRALRAQGIVSVGSISYGTANIRRPVRERLDARVRARKLLPVRIEGIDDIPFWATPEAIAGADAELPETVHILSPFDPLIIQRQRTAALFGYEHLFEAYVAPAKRRLGYFTLPVLHGDEVVAGLDLKTDRAAGKLLIQAWHWLGPGSARRHKRAVETALDRFEDFQLRG